MRKIFYQFLWGVQCPGERGLKYQRFKISYRRGDMRKVLMAVDETESSKSVLSVYKTMVREPESVILVHVQRREGKSMMIDMLSESELKTLKESIQGTEHNEELDRKSEKIMRFYKRELGNGGSAKVKALIKEGIPSVEILKVAQEEKVDLIIMGCNGKTGLQRLVAGRATKEVERAATVPVLVAKAAGCEKSIEYGWREAYAAR
jgi:nucleotide-binding universal stress UspA family protein